MECCFNRAPLATLHRSPANRPHRVHANVVYEYRDMCAHVGGDVACGLQKVGGGVSVVIGGVSGVAIGGVAKRGAGVANCG